MKDWKLFWQQSPQQYDETQFFEQVGKTVKKCPIPADQFQILTKSLFSNLHLKNTDDLLDLCCGNGIVTNQIAHKCHKVIGIDYSPYLIELAKKYNKPANVEYYNVDINALKSWISDDKFDKIYMNEALQHFSPNQFTILLADIKKLMKGDFFLFFGSVPDAERKWLFYNTFARRIDYCFRKIRGTEAIGTWWKKDEIKLITESIGLKVNFLNQPSSLYTSHYRFDMVIYQ
jgi:2-polyprenyl-3-methyl-5-hydroxy-6-metoxy-1,4-benzoquinol methylase